MKQSGWIWAGLIKSRRCWQDVVLFRRSVLEEIQGLDEDFFAYLDDIDLDLRAQLLEYKGSTSPQPSATTSEAERWEIVSTRRSSSY